MTTSELQTIERKTLIRAPRSRVWRALTNPQDFSKWFSADVDGSFAPGKRVELLSTHPTAKGIRVAIIVERMEPEHTFSWRWHPGSAQPDGDGTTYVEIHLVEVAEGTLVTVTETGFDRISLARRAKAFEENVHGWELQLESLKQYVGQAA